MKNSLIYYSVGALLYCPANNETIANSLIAERFGTRYSLALCLEDTIGDNHVDEAELKLISSLNTILHASLSKTFYIPKIFIRVRNPEQIVRLYNKSGKAAELVTGFIIPKFCIENAGLYIEAIENVNKISPKTIYMMPIFESPTIINLKHRYDILYTLKEKLDSIEPYVLNIRVGGNDLCHTFGFRRHSNESIHDIKPVSNIFSDIITVYGMDYIVSGPVWEYYNGDNWDTGLKQEIKQDRLCGFIGKTVIHPKQIDIVNSEYAVSCSDLEDAKNILNWDTSSPSFVSGNSSKERMNEFKTHCNWAKTIMFLSQFYGTK